MKKQIAKLAAMAMAGVMAVGTFTPPLAYAADTDTEYHVPYNEFSQEGGTSRDSIVTWENLGPEDLAKDTVVIIPKNIPLGKDTKSAKYGITVKGAIPYDKKVTVVPRDEIEEMDGTNFYMEDQNPLEALRKADVPATVVQEGTEWLVDEVTPEGTVKQGTVSAPGLTFGTWEGILTFDINMEHTDGAHTHNYTNADGTESETCTKCGIFKDADTGNPGTGDGNDTPPAGHEHTFVDGVCTGCGEKENGGAETPPEHTHSYAEEITRQPTCTEAGIKTLTCGCGDVKTEDVPAVGHNYSDNGRCTACNELNPEHAHSYTGTITKQPTCTEAGEKALTCDCGDTRNEEVPATGHNYVDGECTECHSTIDIPAPVNEISNWNYTLDEGEQTVTLNYYTGSDTEVTVYSSYPVGAKTYKTQIANFGENGTTDVNGR